MLDSTRDEKEVDLLSKMIAVSTWITISLLNPTSRIKPTDCSSLSQEWESGWLDPNLGAIDILATTSCSISSL